MITTQTQMDDSSLSVTKTTYGSLLFENRGSGGIRAYSNSFIDPIDNLEKILSIELDYVNGKIILCEQTRKYKMIEYSMYAKDTKSHFHGNSCYGGPIGSFDTLQEISNFIQQTYLKKMILDSDKGVQDWKENIRYIEAKEFKN